MIDPAKEAYYEYISQNDSYPEHSHQWVVTTYIADPREGNNKGKPAFYRNFGPFDSKETAKEWIESYKAKYTTRRFITKYEVLGLCEVLPSEP